MSELFSFQNEQSCFLEVINWSIHKYNTISLISLPLLQGQQKKYNYKVAIWLCPPLAKNPVWNPVRHMLVYDSSLAKIGNIITPRLWILLNEPIEYTLYHDLEVDMGFTQPKA